MTPFQRGFFCNDQSLRYPYSDCTISVPMLAIFMLLMPLLFISVIEVIRICNDFRLRRYLWNLWHNVAAFSFGFIATYLMAELAKRLIGRLRPHFYAACEPRLPDGSAACSADGDGGGRYIERYICANRNLSLSQQRELQMSFPSSHSALSFFSMIFLCFYLHAAWQSGHVGCRYLRHLLQFIMLMLAWSIALSRVTDYWHHWSDVLAGALLGVAFAMLAAVYVGDLLNSARNRQQAGKKQQQRKQRLEQLQHQHQHQQQPQQQQQHHHQQHQQQQLLQKSASDWKLQTVLAT